MSNVGEEMPKEMARVREMLPIYDAIPMGFLAAAMMRAALDHAAEALSRGDVVAIVRSYAELKDFTL